MSQPIETLPDFPYELIRVCGYEAVAQSLKWREEWRGSFTPVIVGTGEEFGLLTEIWDEV
jgi:hypothetical protein